MILISLKQQIEYESNYLSRKIINASEQLYNNKYLAFYNVLEGLSRVGSWWTDNNFEEEMKGRILYYTYIDEDGILRYSDKELSTFYGDHSKYSVVIAHSFYDLWKNSCEYAHVISIIQNYDYKSYENLLDKYRKFVAGYGDGYWAELNKYINDCVERLVYLKNTSTQQVFIDNV